jgi:hypothetical protein
MVKIANKSSLEKKKREDSKASGRTAQCEPAVLVLE